MSECPTNESQMIELFNYIKLNLFLFDSVYSPLIEIRQTENRTRMTAKINFTNWHLLYRLIV